MLYLITMVRRKFYRKTYQKNKKKRILVLALKFFGFCFLFFIFSFLCLFIYYIKDFPNPEKFTERPYIQSTKIYDRTGKILLYDIYGEEKRTVVPLSSIPEHLKQAVIATEDSNFYHHFGIDPKAIGRAILINLKLKKAIYGGSTISQQLIRSSFLTREKTIKRKIREIISTLELERRYSKDQILEFYLNQIPFGSNCYGVEAASQTFFKKPVSQISLPEAAVLAALIRAPSYLSPYGPHKEELLMRKNYVLDRMVQCGYISKKQAESAKKEPIEFSEILRPIKAPHFVFYVKQYLEQKYGKELLREKGFKVYTSLDWELQQIAEQVVKQGAETNKAYRAFNAALVALDPRTGEILAMVGSKDWHATNYPKDCIPGKNCLFEPKFNIVTQGLRQPGSAFKPFAYAAAFKKGYTPKTVLWDVETNFGIKGTKPYVPQNYTGRFSGPVDLRHSLAQSINVPSVKVLYLAGLENTINLAKNLGITTLNKKPSHYGLSLVLGGGEVKLLDITSAYGVFATQGLRVPPVSVLKIEDSNGNIIEENKKSPKRVLNKQIADLINDILSDNEARAPLFGFHSPLYIENYQTAVKTGTTQEYKDAWTIGYSPTLVVGVWAGNNDNSPTAKAPGVMLSGPIWHKFMEQALLKRPKQEFEKPKRIITNKPVLNGEIDKENPHSILYYVVKDNPQGPAPLNPEQDPQYNNWEQAIKKWLKSHNFSQTDVEL